MAQTRIVWKDRPYKPALRRFSPTEARGGTCWYQGRILIYDDLPCEIKVEGETLTWQGQEFCPASEAAAIFRCDGKQIFPETEPQA